MQEGLDFIHSFNIYCVYDVPGTYKTVGGTIINNVQFIPSRVSILVNDITYINVCQNSSEALFTHNFIKS